MVSKALSSLQFNSDKLQGFHSGPNNKHQSVWIQWTQKNALVAGKKITQLLVESIIMLPRGLVRYETPCSYHRHLRILGIHSSLSLLLSSHHPPHSYISLLLELLWKATQML